MNERHGTILEPEDLTIEALEWTERGYLVAQTIPPGQPFAPTLFSNLALDLATLVDDPLEIEPAFE